MNQRQHTYIEPNGTIWTIFTQGEQPDEHTRPECWTFSAEAHRDEGSPQYTAYDHTSHHAAFSDVTEQIFSASEDDMHGEDA